MKKALTIFLLFSFTFVPILWAGDSVADVWEAANSPVYGTKLGGMLGRGLLNAATCFVDVIVHVVEGSKQGPPIVGTLTGLGSGIACTALRATSGVLDIATSWVPGFNGFPVSRSYSNCLNSEEELKTPSQEYPSAPAPATHLSPEDYAKPAAAAPAAPVRAKHNAYDYVKK